MAGANNHFVNFILQLVGKEKVVSGMKQVENAATTMNKNVMSSASALAAANRNGVASSADLSNALGKVNNSTKLSKDAISQMGNAMSRALQVAPVWMAVRGAIQAVTSTVEDGFRTWMEFDAQLTKSKAVIHGYAGGTGEAMKILEKTVSDYSKSSGVSLADVTSSFYRFGTVGISFEQSLSGAIASGKLANATLGDSDTIARALAMTYRLLGKSIDQTLTPQQQQEQLAGKIYHLWKSNAFEANEFASSLNNFASTANIANFSADETISLLAALGTAGVQGAKGGTLLKSSIQQLVKNLDQLAPTLGIAVNPELEDTFDVLMRVLGAIHELSKSGKGIPEGALGAIQKIFGGVRGGQPIQALNALFETMTANNKALTGDALSFIKDLQERTDDVNKQAFKQVEIFNRMKEQIGQAFVRGIVGGKDFASSMQNINATANESIPLFGKLGKLMVNAIDPTRISFVKGDVDNIKEMVKGQEDFNKRVKDGIAGTLSLKDTLDLIGEIQLKKGTVQIFNADKVQKQLQESANKVAKEGVKIPRILLEIDAIEAKINPESKENLNKSLLEDIGLSSKTFKEGLNVKGMKQLGFKESEVSLVKMTQEIAKMVNEYNQLDKVSKGLLPTLDKQNVLQELLKGNFQGVIDKAQGEFSVTNSLKNLAEERSKLEESIALEFVGQNSSVKALMKTLAEANLQTYERERIQKQINVLVEQNSKAWAAQRGFQINPMTITGQTESSIYDAWRSNNRAITSNKTATNMPITVNLTGAITNNDIEALKQKIEEEIKKQPNYVGNMDVASALAKDSVQAKRVADAIRDKL